MKGNRLQFAVVGGATCNDREAEMAYDVGRDLAEKGITLLCGGRDGVMLHAAQGAHSAGGLTVGILPGRNASESPPNPYISVALFTGLGQARNQVLVLSAAAVIAVGGGWGTLSEIALAGKHNIPTVLLDSWQLRQPGAENDSELHIVSDAAAAVSAALSLAHGDEAD